MSLTTIAAYHRCANSPCHRQCKFAHRAAVLGGLTIRESSQYIPDHLFWALFLVTYTILGFETPKMYWIWQLDRPRVALQLAAYSNTLTGYERQPLLRPSRPVPR